MPKMKTKRGAAKRFKKTGTGKFKRSRANRRHILTTKSQKQKRQSRSGVVVDPSNAYSLKRMLPYL
jgi:large subunit ribosomal protein L35